MPAGRANLLFVGKRAWGRTLGNETGLLFELASKEPGTLLDFFAETDPADRQAVAAYKEQLQAAGAPPPAPMPFGDEAVISRRAAARTSWVHHARRMTDSHKPGAEAAYNRAARQLQDALLSGAVALEWQRLAPPYEVVIEPAATWKVFDFRIEFDDRLLPNLRMRPRGSLGRPAFLISTLCNMKEMLFRHVERVVEVAPTGVAAGLEAASPGVTGGLVERTPSRTEKAAADALPLFLSLVERWKAEGGPKPKKADVLTTMRAQFRELPELAFNQIWTDNAPEYWSQGGRPKKNPPN